MATGYLTMLDLAERTKSDQIIGLVEEVTSLAPEFSIVPAITKPGTTYKATLRTANPTAAFRDANSANTIGKSTYKQVSREMYFLDVPLSVDEAIVKADDGTVGDLLAQEAMGALQSATLYLGSQFYYGTSNDNKGFTGLLAASAGKWPAGGTTNSTSAFLVWTGPQGVAFVVGRDGEIAMPSWTKQAVISGTGATATQRFSWVTNLSAYIGLQVLSASSVWRVSGITAAAPLTDARGAGLLSKVPLTRRSGLRWFMNRTAFYTLQASRASLGFVAPSSAGSPTVQLGNPAAFAPGQETLAGVPITITDSLVDTDTNAGTADTYATENT